MVGTIIVKRLRREMKKRVIYTIGQNFIYEYQWQNFIHKYQSIKRISNNQNSSVKIFRYVYYKHKDRYRRGLYLCLLLA
jgi:hypothetical protein